MALADSFQLAFRSIIDQFSTVKATLPPAYFFKLPPSSLPRTLPPPSDHPTLAHPFTISHETYNFFLQPQIPVTIALIYVTLATYLNAVNTRRKLKPWAFSQTAFFKSMVITHNAILAIYSFWTFIGMVNALRRSFYPPWEEHGFAGTVDSMCKVNGPRGYGTGATFNETTSAWGIANHVFHLGADGLLPDSTDVGRIWNEGLAFYGWLFYLSKFYEVIDTFIILAKGRKSSFLQTYHHAGAMLCMWAGIRYMSPPIWMFVLVNSFIHTIMYTFYFCISLHIKVPVWFKRTLTTMQITQFVVGATYAFLHLFVKYRMPISVPYFYRFGSAVSAAPSAASSAMATAVATVDGAALLKKLLLRAAGREGLAENVLSNKRGQAASFDALHAVRDFAGREELRYKQDAIWTHCIDTSGQAFAIWLNCLYLLPLTWLFGRFFIKSYLKREERRRSSAGQTALLSSRDAYKGVSRRVSEAFEDLQHGVEDDSDDVAVIDGAEFKKEINKVASTTKKGMSNALDELKEKTDPLKAKAEDELQSTLQKARETIDKTKANMPDNIGERSSTIIQETREAFEEAARSLSQKARETTDSVVESISQFTSSAKEETRSVAQSSEEAKEAAEQRVPQLRTKESSHRSTNSQEFEDQQSSWIHVKDEAEEAVGKAVEGVRSTLEPLTSSTSTDKNESKATEAEFTSQPDSPKSPEKSPKKHRSRGKKHAAKESKAAGESANTSSEGKQQTDSHSTTGEHGHPTYAEVAAETATPETDDQPGSQSSENKQESTTAQSTTGAASADTTKDTNESKETTSQSQSTKSSTTKSSSTYNSKSEESRTETISEVKNQASDIINAVRTAAESLEGKAKAEAESFVAKIESGLESGDQTSQSASGLMSKDDTLWFEKLTTGIDSKTSTGEAGPSKKDMDKIIDESETVRDDVVDTAKDEKDESADGA